MAWQPTPYSLLGFTTAGMSALLALLAWRHRARHEALPFLALVFTLGGWAVASGIQFGYASTSDQVVWKAIGLAIGGLIPTMWLLFTIRYARKDAWLTRPRLLALAVEPLVFALLVLTNAKHGLIWTDATGTTTAAGPAVRFGLNVGYYVHTAYAYLLIAAGVGFLVVVFLRSSQIYQRQAGLLIAGTPLPTVANVAYTLRVSWGPLPAVNPTPLAFIITGLVFGLALFQFDLLERTPVARRRALQRMGDGLVILDAQGTIVDTNAVSRRVLDPIPAIGDAFTECTPTDAATAEEALAAFDGRTLTTTGDSRRRVYDTECSSLSDHRGETVGYIVTLRDVTARYQYEQRLDVANRVLRHNLRNEMTVIRGWATEFAESVTGEHAAGAEQIVERADALIQLGEKTRTMVRLDEYVAGEPVSIETDDRLATLLAEFREAYPAVAIEHADGSSPPVRAPHKELFDIPVRNLIENAIEHNDTAEPWVRVHATGTDDHVRVHIADNGPEIPAIEREVLETGPESQLRHGSGMGLWLTHWSMEILSGRVSFETNEHSGNTVVLVFPRADRDSS